jgi:hypothetical protein
MSPSVIVDVQPGLWLWRMPHPDWDPGEDVDRWVTSTCVETGGETVVIDPLAPPDVTDPVWERLDTNPPTVIAVLKPDHVRSVDVFASRYPGARVFGPDVFHKGDVPRTDLEPIYPGDVLPGGLVALYDGRGRNETPLWIPEHGTIVFSDAMTGLGGDLQIWTTPWHEGRVMPAMRSLLDLDFERVIVSHGQPIHDRAAFERALNSEPYAGSP